MRAAHHQKKVGGGSGAGKELDAQELFRRLPQPQVQQLIALSRTDQAAFTQACAVFSKQAGLDDGSAGGESLKKRSKREWRVPKSERVAPRWKEFHEALGSSGIAIEDKDGNPDMHRSGDKVMAIVSAAKKVEAQEDAEQQVEDDAQAAREAAAREVVEQRRAEEKATEAQRLADKEAKRVALLAAIDGHKKAGNEAFVAKRYVEKGRCCWCCYRHDYTPADVLPLLPHYHY